MGGDIAPLKWVGSLTLKALFLIGVAAMSECYTVSASTVMLCLPADELLQMRLQPTSISSQAEIQSASIIVSRTQ